MPPGENQAQAAHLGTQGQNPGALFTIELPIVTLEDATDSCCLIDRLVLDLP